MNNAQPSFFEKLRIRSAGYWLRLGEADEALRELEGLPRVAWEHPSAVKARVNALQVLAGRSESACRNEEEAL